MLVHHRPLLPLAGGKVLRHGRVAGRLDLLARGCDAGVPPADLPADAGHFISLPSDPCEVDRDGLTRAATGESSPPGQRVLARQRGAAVSRARDDAGLPAIAVGGGPAGAAFALELARHGRRVIILERTAEPHHKVCGEFLSAEAQAILQGFGLVPYSLGARSITHLRLARGKRRAVAALPFAAAALSRLQLDQLLLDAAARAGAEIVRGVRVTGIGCDGGALRVVSGDRSWRAAAVALATGKRSLRGLGAPPGSMVGFKLHLDAPHAAAILRGIVQLAFFPGGYVGASLVEDDALSLAWVMQEQLVRAVGSDWARQSRWLVRQAPVLGDVLDYARPLFAKPLATAAIPYGFLRAGVIAPAVYPVGDQLAVVPSFTGDGMAIALLSGVAAAAAVLQRQPAADYQRQLIAPLRRQFRLAGGLDRLLANRVASPLMVGAARWLPFLVRRLADATRLRMPPMPNARLTRVAPQPEL